MTTVKINPGVCGMTTEVQVVKKGRSVFSITIQSDCEMVEQLGRELGELTVADIFKTMLDNPLYRRGSACLNHVSCPVPSGVLKALEVAAGLAVPGNVTIEFLTDSSE